MTPDDDLPPSSCRPRRAGARGTKFRHPDKARFVVDLKAGKLVAEVDAPSSRKKPDHSAHAELLIQVRDMLRAEGCHVRVIDSKPVHVPDGRGGFKMIAGRNKGMLDLLACVPGGRFLAIDIKAGSDRLTPEQVTECERIRAAGGVSGEARSIEDARRLLEEARS